MKLLNFLIILTVATVAHSKSLLIVSQQNQSFSNSQTLTSHSLETGNFESLIFDGIEEASSIKSISKLNSDEIVVVGDGVVYKYEDDKLETLLRANEALGTNSVFGDSTQSFYFSKYSAIFKLVNGYAVPHAGRPYIAGKLENCELNNILDAVEVDKKLYVFLRNGILSIVDISKDNPRCISSRPLEMNVVATTIQYSKKNKIFYIGSKDGKILGANSFTIYRPITLWQPSKELSVPIHAMVVDGDEIIYASARSLFKYSITEKESHLFKRNAFTLDVKDLEIY